MSKHRRRGGKRAGPNDWDSAEPDNQGARDYGRHDGKQRERRREARRERRAEHVSALVRVPARAEPEPSTSWVESLLSPFGGWESRAGPTCGGCRNWITHNEPGGRGTCDHPGSGFSYPFEDTPACPFFAKTR